MKFRYKSIMVLLVTILIVLAGYYIFNSINTRNRGGTENNSIKDFRKIFKDDLFLGDSITKGLSIYKFLYEENICATVGINTSGLKDEIDKIDDLKPKKIFIMCGVNDISNGLSVYKFENNYLELIYRVKGKFPESQIYVQSILPVVSEAKGGKFGISNVNIKEYNKRHIEICNKEGITYINTASILKASNKNLYETDGLHFKAQFYPIWLTYLQKSVNYKDVF